MKNTIEKLKELKQKHEENKPYDYLAKVVIIGDSAVGKTNIMLRYVNQNYTMSHTPTIGVDFKSKTLLVSGNKTHGSKKIKLQLWDTAGQQRFRTITQTYYNGASGIVVVYAINDRKSFTNLNQWLFQIAQHNGQNIPKLLIGNKCDLQNERVITYQQGKILADQHNAVFMQVSAKQNINIQQAFMILCKNIKDVVDKDNDDFKKQLKETKSKDKNIKIQRKDTLNIVVNSQKKSDCCK